ncbi:MAG TPA: phosphate butyryltransferase [Bacteroidetes bacterium]|nr:phosphate acetyltransferase [bacterium BMS3Bbin04]HDO65196.1 phosphate butyryltransferase [Bacteroidota bacterium]HEX04321.1 phosphate butyryltransferase [Bacteroidota bacterium]
MPAELPFLDQPLKSHHQVIERAKLIGRTHGLSSVVVAAAEEDDVLAAMYACKQEGISDAILTGNPENIRKALDLAKVPADSFDIIATESDQESALKAANLAASGEADVVMKGFLKTSILLKTLLKSDNGLRDRELVSHSALLYVPKYGKLLNVTDGGTIPTPDLRQKLVVIQNAVRVLRAVGVAKPNIAVFGSGESINDKYPETLDAQDLVSVAAEHWKDEINISGPMPLDLAIKKPEDLNARINDQVAGYADILLVHTLEQGNIIAKTLIQFGDAIFMGVIAGAKVPISLVSRSDSMMNKMASIALAVCLADFQRRNIPALPSIIANEQEIQ